MKRLLTISFVALALIIGASGISPHAAQADCLPGSVGCDLPATSQSECTAVGGTWANDQCANATVQAPSDNVFTPTPASTNTPTDPKLGKETETFGFVMHWILSLFAWLVGVAAIVLDYAVYYTVVTMGDYINGLSAIGVTWKVMRDIGNIFLIFGFLIAGIATIISYDLYGWGKKMIPMLLVAAVFLNFSLFIAEAVIDTGNLFATQFYTQIKGGTLPTQATLSQTTIESEGISNKIMAQLGLQTIYTESRRNTEIFKAGNTWVIGFMGILLFLVAAFVMFALAFILIARFVILLFLIIVAPIGFAGLAIPKLEATAKKWWSALFEQTITAPVLLLMLYIALAVITDARFLTGLCRPAAGSTNTTCTSNWIGWVDGNFAGFASMLLSFLIAMGLLIAVVILAKKMSAFGAGWAIKTAGAASFGATAWAGRNTGGWLANKAARGLRKTAFARVPLVGTGLVRGLEGVAGSSFDVRGVKRFGGLKAAGIEAGDAQKGGYKADLKKRTEARTKYAEDLKGRDLTDAEKARQAVLQNLIKQKQKERNRATTEAEFNAADSAIKAAERQLEDIEKVTDKGAQRKYAKVLELGLDSKGTLNKYFNFAANTEAARKIRDGAKKAKGDKDWSSNIKNLIKEANEEEEGGAGAAGGGTAGGGASPAGGATPGGGGSTTSGGGSGASTP